MNNDDAMNYNEYYAQQVGGALPYFTGLACPAWARLWKFARGSSQNCCTTDQTWRAGAGKSCIKDWHTNSW